MALGLGLGLTFTRSFANLDPDARAYVAAVRAAGATVSGAQATAISNFIIGEKAASRWTSLKYLSLPIWNVTAANAIDMVSLVSGTFFGGSTIAPGYWQPDGTTGYFNANRTAIDFGQTTASSSVGAMLLQAGSGTGTRVIVHGFNGVSQLVELQHASTLNTLTLNVNSTTPPGPLSATVLRALQDGVLIGTREGGSRSVYRRINTSFTTLRTLAGADAGTVPTGTFKAARSDFGGGAAYNDAQYAAIFAGTGWTQSYSQGFSLALQTLWENIMGQVFPYDVDAVAYVAAVRAAGATVTTAQENAINEFIIAEKTDSRWTSLKRMYLPIWGVAAANAIDMVTRNSGVWSGSFVHNAGTVKADGVTANFDLGTSLTAESLTASTGYMFSLVTTASTLGFRGLIGRVQSSNTGSVYSSNSGQLFRWFTVGAQSSVSSAGTGIISCSRQGGNAAVYRRITASRTVLGTTARADAGTVPTGGNVAAFALNTNPGTGYTAGEFNDCTMGAFGMGLGFTDAQDSAFTANLRTLWETTTGLLLIDADAQAYVTAVQSAGATVSSAQAVAISNFIDAEKVAGRWTSMKRFYLPIWGVAAANAIDMVTRASGTFFGGVTQGAGFVQGDGTTGYFDTGVGMSTLGMSSASCLIGALAYQADPRAAGVSYIGNISGAKGQLIGKSSGTTLNGRITNTGLTLGVTVGTETGIVTMGAVSDASRALRRRVTAGATSVATSAGEAAFALDNSNTFALARNFGGLSQPTQAAFGSYFLSTGLSDAATDGLTLNLKTLWETTTGLVLP